MAGIDRDRSDGYASTVAGARRPGATAAYSTRFGASGTGPRFGPPPAQPGATRLRSPGTNTAASPAPSSNIRPGGYAELAQLRKGGAPGVSPQPRSKTPAAVRSALPHTPSTRRALTPPSRVAGRYAQPYSPAPASAAGTGVPVAGSGPGPSRQTVMPTAARSPAASTRAYVSPHTPPRVVHSTTTAHSPGAYGASPDQGPPAYGPVGGNQWQYDDDDVAMYGSSVMCGSSTTMYDNHRTMRPAIGVGVPAGQLPGQLVPRPSTTTPRFQEPGEDWMGSYERSSTNLLQELEGILGGLSRLGGFVAPPVEARAPPLPLPATPGQPPPDQGSSPLPVGTPAPLTPGPEVPPMPQPTGAPAQAPDPQAQPGAAPPVPAASPLGATSGPAPAAAATAAEASALLATWPQVQPAHGPHPTAHPTADGASQGQSQSQAQPQAGASAGSAAAVQSPQPPVPMQAATMALPAQDGHKAEAPGSGGAVRGDVTATADGVAAAGPSVSLAALGAVLPPGTLQELWRVLQASNRKTARLMADLAAARREVELANERAEEADSLARAYQQQLVTRQQRVASWQVALAEMEEREVAAKQQLVEAQERCSELAQRADQAERVAAMAQLRFERLAAQRAAQLQAGRESLQLSEGGVEEQRSREEARKLHMQLGNLRADLAAAQTRATRAELELAMARNKAQIAQQELATEEDRARRAAAAAATAREELGRTRFALELLGRDHDRLQYQLQDLRIQRHLPGGEERPQRGSGAFATVRGLDAKSTQPQPSAALAPMGSARSEWRPSPERPPAALPRPRPQPDEARRAQIPTADASNRTPGRPATSGTANHGDTSATDSEPAAAPRPRPRSQSAFVAPYGSSNGTSGRTVPRTSDSSKSTSSGGSLATALGLGRRRREGSDSDAAGEALGPQRVHADGLSRQRQGSLLLLAPGEVPLESNASLRYGQQRQQPTRRRSRSQDLGSAPNAPTAGEGSGGRGGGGGGGGWGRPWTPPHSGGQSPAMKGALARCATPAAHEAAGRSPGSRPPSRLGVAARRGVPSGDGSPEEDEGSNAGMEGLGGSRPKDGGERTGDAGSGGEAGWSGPPAVTLAALRAGYASASGAYRGASGGTLMHEMLPLTRVPSSGARRRASSIRTSQGSSSRAAPPLPAAAAAAHPAAGGVDATPATAPLTSEGAVGVHTGRTAVRHFEQLAQTPPPPQQRQPQPQGVSTAAPAASEVPIAAPSTRQPGQSPQPPGQRHGDVTVSLADLRRQMAAATVRAAAPDAVPVGQPQLPSGPAVRPQACAGPPAPLLVPEQLPPLEPSYSPRDRDRVESGAAWLPLGLSSCRPSAEAVPGQAALAGAAGAGTTASGLCTQHGEMTPAAPPAPTAIISPVAAGAGPADTSLPQGYRTSHLNDLYESRQDRWSGATAAAALHILPQYGTQGPPQYPGLEGERQLPYGSPRPGADGPPLQFTPRTRMLSPCLLDSHLVRPSVTASMMSAYASQEGWSALPRTSETTHSATGPRPSSSLGTAAVGEPPKALPNGYLPHPTAQQHHAWQQHHHHHQPSGSAIAGVTPLLPANVVGAETSPKLAWWQRLLRRRRRSHRSPSRSRGALPIPADAAPGVHVGKPGALEASPARTYGDATAWTVSERGSQGTGTQCRVGSPLVATGSAVPAGSSKSGGGGAAGGGSRRHGPNRSGGGGMRVVRSALLHLGMWSGGVAFGVLLVLGLAGVVEGVLGVGAAAAERPSLRGSAGGPGCGCPGPGHSGKGGAREEDDGARGKAKAMWRLSE